MITADDLKRLDVLAEEVAKLVQSKANIYVNEQR